MHNKFLRTLAVFGSLFALDLVTEPSATMGTPNQEEEPSESNTKKARLTELKKSRKYYQGLLFQAQMGSNFGYHSDYCYAQHNREGIVKDYQLRLDHIDRELNKARDPKTPTKISAETDQGNTTTDKKDNAETDNE